MASNLVVSQFFFAMNPSAFSLNKPFTIHHPLSKLPPSLSQAGRTRSATQLIIRIRSENTNEPEPEPMGNEAETAGIRFRRVSRKRAREQRRKEKEEEEGVPRKEAAVKKEWESMNLTEKAIEVYVGEKGLLFWLNKFAYASIFIIIGGWILFRFVGPSLNLYQLDQPPLSPSSVFKG